MTKPIDSTDIYMNLKLAEYRKRLGVEKSNSKICLKVGSGSSKVAAYFNICMKP